MKKKYIKIVLSCSMFMFLFGCKADPNDWKNPKKIYTLICDCQNSKGQTIDQSTAAFVESKGVTSPNNEKVTKYISEHPDEFVEHLEQSFIADLDYQNNYKTIMDTLDAHDAELDVQGNLGKLFSIKAKYPACLAALAYLNSTAAQ